MQKIMMGTDRIKENGEYAIKYSPGMIFANKVPALDIDFIGANKESDEITIDGKDIQTRKEMKDLIKAINNLQPEKKFEHVATYSESKFNSYFSADSTLPIDEEDPQNFGFSLIVNDYALYRPEVYVNYSFGDEFLTIGNITQELHHVCDHTWNPLKLDRIQVHIHKGFLYAFFIEGSDTLTLYRFNLSEIELDPIEIELKYTSYALKSHIAKWYKALRTIALVGLLSVLVYVGIQIILSSNSSQKQAKYKNMLMDWLVAICILFVLHYIMAFLLNFIGGLNEIILDNVIQTSEISGNESDKLISNIRQEIIEIADGNSNEKPGATAAGYTLMYLALVMLTFTFTMFYLKRVILVAFLTMIAPMIALTYPLDKIKDGKAQAFNYWLKEYIFNCLIQPVHLLLYTLLVTNAGDFATENILYSIIAIAFLVPAEKLIKEMFGIKSQATSTSAITAAAGGALAMNMVNKLQKIRGNGGKSSGESEKSENPSAVRTAGAGTAGAGGSQSGTLAQAGGSTGTGTNKGAGSGAQGSSGYSAGNGIKALGKKYIYGPDAIKSHGKKFTGALGGAALGVAAGTVSLASQMADGDLIDNPIRAATETMAGAGVGYLAGKNISQNVANKVKNVASGVSNAVETYKKGAHGEEAYNNMKFNKEFYGSDGYRQIAEDNAIKTYAREMETSTEALTQRYLDNGVTDAGKIKEALQQGITGDEYKEFKNMGIDDPKRIGKIKKRFSHRTASELAARATIADQCKEKGITSKNAFTKFVKMYGGLGLTDEQCEEFYKEIQNYW